MPSSAESVSKHGPQSEHTPKVSNVPHPNDPNNSRSRDEPLHSDASSTHSGASSEQSEGIPRYYHHHRHNGDDDNGTSDTSDGHASSDSSDASDDALSEISFGSSQMAGSLSGLSGSLRSHSHGPNVAKIQQHRKTRAKKFVRKGQVKKEEPPFALGEAGRRERPRSYFERNNTETCFSLTNESHCFITYLKHLWASIEEDRLPWLRDFLDLRKMRQPKNTKEIKSRLNLNIPYYAANYLQLFYGLTLPFLLFYNTPFFIVLVVACVVIHSVSMRRRGINCYDTAVVVLDHRIQYHTLGHAFVFCILMLFMFFNGLKTVAIVALLNACVILPHAVLRRTTFFDDEEMEKCRPKLTQYALTLLFLVLCYLEGAAADEAEAAAANRNANVDSNSGGANNDNTNGSGKGVRGTRTPGRAAGGLASSDSPSPAAGNPNASLSTLVGSKMGRSLLDASSSASFRTLPSQNASIGSLLPAATAVEDQAYTNHLMPLKERQKL